MDYFDQSQFGTGAQNLWQSNGAWGSGEEYGGSLAESLKTGTQLFQQQFKNLAGRDPTPDELGAFQTQALYTGGVEKMSYGDMSGLANAFINNTYGPQIAQYQQQQQTQNQQQQLQQTQSDSSNLVNQLNQQTQNYLTNPQTQQQIQGQLNNNGLLNSGAYSSTLAGLMAQGANQNEANVLGGVSIPALQNIQGLSNIGGNPYQQSLSSGQFGLSNIEGLNNFQMEADLARQLSEGGGSNALGMAAGSAQGLGSLLQGGAQAKQATSYICKELIRRGFICEMDMDDFHTHIMPAMFRKGRAFWKYAMDGEELVYFANARGADWAKYKKLFFDCVMAEPDPFRAVDLYANACEQLCNEVAPWLWDSRVYRTSFFDSLFFLPRLLTYVPFLDALKKTIRIKMLWIYDRGYCGGHQ